MNWSESSRVLVEKIRRNWPSDLRLPEGFVVGSALPSILLGESYDDIDLVVTAKVSAELSRTGLFTETSKTLSIRGRDCTKFQLFVDDQDPIDHVKTMIDFSHCRSIMDIGSGELILDQVNIQKTEQKELWFPQGELNCRLETALPRVIKYVSRGWSISRAQLYIAAKYWKFNAEAN